MLNVAATCASTTALGPGRRAVAWVQGCPLRCPGCIAPEWIPDVPAESMTPRELADRLLEDPAVTGVTFSGGEPMGQACGLAETIAIARQERDLTLICFTGYRLGQLRARPRDGGVPRLLAEVDVLIDGPYVQALDPDRGLRGSTNQRVHHLTERLRGCGFDFEDRPRDIEIRLAPDGIQMIGVPARSATAALDAIMPRAQAAAGRRASDER